MPSFCPICQKPAQADSAPFCSARCREVDLNRWFTGSYAVPAVELDEGEIEALENGTSVEDTNPH